MQPSNRFLSRCLRTPFTERKGDWMHRIHLGLRVLAIAATLAMAPVTLSSGQVTANNACADDGCCKNPDGICETDRSDYIGYENKNTWQKLLGC